LLLLICVVCLASCGSPSSDADLNFPNADLSISGAAPDVIYEIEAIVLNEDGGSLMFYTINGVNSTLATVSTKNAKLIASDGTTITRDDFKTGQLVTITFDGLIAESYPVQINSCYGIRVTGEADADETAEALAKYMFVHTVENTVYYVDTSGTLAKKMVAVTFGDIFGEWKKANGVPEGVTLLGMSAEDNAREEINGEMAVYYAATVRNFYLDLSAEFLTYLASATDERMVVASLVKTIIGDNPPAADTAVFLTVNGSLFKTEKNDFSGRLNFEMYITE
jgi:hypothetical protein